MGKKALEFIPIDFYSNNLKMNQHMPLLVGLSKMSMEVIFYQFEAKQNLYGSLIKKVINN